MGTNWTPDNAEAFPGDDCEEGRSEMAKLTDAMKKVLAEHSLGYVASIAADGTPSLSPKATFMALGDEKIMFAEMRSPTTVKNIAVHPMVEVNFVDVLARKGFRAKGPAVFHAKGSDEYASLESHYASKGPDLLAMVNGIVVITIDSASMLISPAYEIGATEADLREPFKEIYGKL